MPPWPGRIVPESFYAGAAFDQGFHQIAELRGNIEGNRQQDDRPTFPASPGRTSRRDAGSTHAQ